MSREQDRRSAPPGPSIPLAAAIVALSVALGLGLAEIALRALGTAADYRMGDFEIRLDRELLFRLKPRCVPDVNSLGYRDHEFTAAKNGKRRILFFGDSFVLGAGVPPARSLPKALERRLGPGVEVLNFGVYGYGPDQAQRAFRADGARLEPDLVLLGLFPGNDFEDLVKNELLLADDSGRVRENPTNPVAAVLPRSALVLKARMALTGHFLDPGAERALVKRLVVDPYTRLGPPDSPETRRRVALMEAALAAWKAETSRRGIPLGVVVIPAFESMSGDAGGGSPFANEEAALSLLRKAGISAADLRGPFLGARDVSLYNERDRHLSPAGNELAAAVVADFIRPLW